MTVPSAQQPILRQWLHEPLTAEVSAAVARLQATEGVCHVAIMPDVHLAREVCVGVVLATRNRLFPQAVGSDIGCGMAVIGFDCEADVIAHEHSAGRALAGLYEAVPIMRQPRRQLLERLPEPLQDAPLSDPRLEKFKIRDGRVQFATLGRGNHFLEFQADESGRLWLMVHSGSRALGQAIADHHLRGAKQTRTGLKYLDADSPQGRAYLADLQWAIHYAELSRRKMVQQVVELMKRLFRVEAETSSFLHCDHNHIRREPVILAADSHPASATSVAEHLWIHRKGAISAAADEPGIIPGSMGSASFHVRGRGCAGALCSSSHGAGRAMSREHARRRVSVRSLERQMRGIWFDHRSAANLREEAPEAYKDVDAVMRAQHELTRIVRRLRPVLSYKGS